VGYADSADEIVSAQPVNTVEVRYTLMSDANLDGVVNATDAVLLGRNYKTNAGIQWDHGDFNYDGAVDFSDALILQKNWNAALPANSPAVVATPAVALPANPVPSGAPESPPANCTDDTTVMTSSASAPSLTPSAILSNTTADSTTPAAVVGAGSAATSSPSSIPTLVSPVVSAQPPTAISKSAPVAINRLVAPAIAPSAAPKAENSAEPDPQLATDAGSVASIVISGRVDSPPKAKTPSGSVNWTAQSFFAQTQLSTAGRTTAEKSRPSNDSMLMMNVASPEDPQIKKLHHKRGSRRPH
jgi:hypothetical protein